MICRLLHLLNAAVVIPHFHSRFDSAQNKVCHNIYKGVIVQKTHANSKLDADEF